MTTRSTPSAPSVATTRIVALAAGLAITVLAPLAIAAGEGHETLEALPKPKAGIAPMVTALAVFALVAIILLTQVWPKIAKGLDDRNAKIKEEIEAAEMARQQAKDALEQYQEALAKARSEAQAMLDQTRAQQAVMAEELKKKSDAELSSLREKALRDIEMAKKAAVAEIYTESATLATAMASKILKRQITVEDQGRLIDETVSNLNVNRN